MSNPNDKVMSVFEKVLEEEGLLDPRGYDVDGNWDGTHLVKVIMVQTMERRIRRKASKANIRLKKTRGQTSTHISIHPISGERKVGEGSPVYFLVEPKSGRIVAEKNNWGTKYKGCIDQTIKSLEEIENQVNQFKSV